MNQSLRNYSSPSLPIFRNSFPVGDFNFFKFSAIDPSIFPFLFFWGHTPCVGKLSWLFYPQAFEPLCPNHLNLCALTKRIMVLSFVSDSTSKLCLILKEFYPRFWLVHISFLESFFQRWQNDGDLSSSVPSITAISQDWSYQCFINFEFYRSEFNIWLIIFSIFRSLRILFPLFLEIFLLNKYKLAKLRNVMVFRVQVFCRFILSKFVTCLQSYGKLKKIFVVSVLWIICDMSIETVLFYLGKM